MLKAVLYLRFRDFRNNFFIMLVMIVMGLVLTGIFGASMGGNYKPPIYITDLDQTVSSEMFIHKLKEQDSFEFHLSDEEDALLEVKNNRAVGAIIIKEGFEKNLEEGSEVTIDLIKQREVVEIIQLRNMIQSTLQLTTSKVKMINNLYDSIGTSFHIDEKSFEDRLMENYHMYNTRLSHMPTYSTEIIHFNNEEIQRSYDSLLHSLIGFTLFFSTFPIVFNIADILNDKKKNTFDRIMISPLSKNIYLAGNMIFTIFVGTFQIMVLVFAGQYLFGVDWGNQLPLILSVFLAFIVAMTCLGLFISGLVKTYSQLSALTPIVLTSFGMLGGCMWPLEIVSNKVLLFLANITPHKWAVESIEQLTQTGTGVTEAYEAIAVMLLMSCIYFIIGRRVLRTE